MLRGRGLARFQRRHGRAQDEVGHERGDSLGEEDLDDEGEGTGGQVAARARESDEGEHEDWIEIYNDNDEAINLAGLYITDDLGNPLKFQIPFGDPDATTVPGKGFLYFWADEAPQFGAQHIGLKLGAGGEEILRR